MSGVRTAGCAAVCRAGLVIAVCAALWGPVDARAVASPQSGRAATIAVGATHLNRCASAPVAYCGRLAVPLDHLRADGPRISVAFRWYPASRPSGGVAGTIVPVEGGPGFGSIGSVATGYAPMYGPLLEHWNMLVVDNRGTGASTLINCPVLQSYPGSTTTPAYQHVVAACAASLNERWHYRGGEPVHGSDMFTTAAASEDLAEVIAAMKAGPVALYGDSYGSWFSQAFASRYPQDVRSLVLDSTYPTVELEPWYTSTIGSMPADFNAACARWPPCAQAASGSAWDRVAQVAALLRQRPIAGVVPGPTGSSTRVTMTAVGLIDLISNATFDLQIYRDLDAADRALLLDGDPLALLRLFAQRLAFDETYSREPASSESQGLYYAVSCLDYPQLFSVHSSIPVREAQLAEAAAALPAATFSPFTTSEWLGQSQNLESYTPCLRWPAPTAGQPVLAHGPPLLPSTLPVLVLGGEFDTITPPRDHPKILGALGGHARFVVLANATHVVGEEDTVCGDRLVREFVANPAALDTIDASCAASNPPVHAVGAFPANVAAEQPLTPAAGNHAGEVSLRLAAAALQTAGDAVAREQAIAFQTDAGLHGGSVLASRAGQTLELADDELIPGVPVSGTITIVPAGNPLDGARAAATLSVGGASLSASWTTSGGAATATVTGTAEGAHLSGTFPAP